MPEEGPVEHVEAGVTPDDAVGFDDVDELLVEEVSIDGMCGVY